MRLLKLGIGRRKAPGRRAAARGPVGWGAVAVLAAAVSVVFVGSVAAQSAPNVEVDSLTVSIAELETGDRPGQVEEGEEATYTWVVKNTGTATSAALTTSLEVNGSSTGVGTISCNPTLTTLTAGAETKCTATRNVVAGDLTRAASGNRAVGTMTSVAKVSWGAGANENDDMEVNTLLTGTASITFNSKTVESDGLKKDVSGLTNRVDNGDTLTYTYKVTNGPMPVANVKVTDGIFGKFDCGTGELDANAVRTCTKTFTLTQEQIDAGSVPLTAATASAEPSGLAAGRAAVTDTVDAGTKTDLPQSKGIEVEQTNAVINMAVAGPKDRPDVIGDKKDTVTYTFTVKNTGNVTLTGVKLAAPDGTAICSGKTLVPEEAETTATTPTTTPATPATPTTPTTPPSPTTTTPATTTTATSTATCTKVVALTQAQINGGEFTYAAVASGTAPDDSSADPNTNTAKTTLERVATVSLVTAKTKPAGKVKEGETVTYSLTVTNTGNVTLTEVTVKDSKTTVTCPDTTPAKTLAPAAKLVCTTTYKATEADVKATKIVNKGTVTATAGTDKVSGESTVSFGLTVDRQSGKDRYLTAVEISKETFSKGVKVVYIATGANFPDALAGSAAAGGDGPILLVMKDSIPKAPFDEIKRLQPQEIIVLGGTGVVSEKVETALKKLGRDYWKLDAKKVTRQAGSDRYSTAAEISAKHFKAGVPVAYVATGADFPDALAGGPAAAKLGGPILLTQKDKVPGATVKELKRLKPKRIVVLGGTGVVPASVQVALKSYTTGKVDRVSGSDRYLTAQAISKSAFKANVPVVYIATGANFPDALAGGAAGAALDGPVLLVTGTSIPKATEDELKRLKPKHIVVLGGTAAVSAKVQTDLNALLP